MWSRYERLSCLSPLPALPRHSAQTNLPDMICIPNRPPCTSAVTASLVWGDEFKWRVPPRSDRQRCSADNRKFVLQIAPINWLSHLRRLTFWIKSAELTSTGLLVGGHSWQRKFFTLSGSDFLFSFSFFFDMASSRITVKIWLWILAHLFYKYMQHS